MKATTEYIFEEFEDMKLAYGEAKGNLRRAERLYEQRFPSSSIPSPPTFVSVNCRLRVTASSFAVSNNNARRSWNVRNAETSEAWRELQKLLPNVRERWHKKWIFLSKGHDIFYTKNTCILPRAKGAKFTRGWLSLGHKFCRGCLGWGITSHDFLPKYYLMMSQQFWRDDIFNLSNEHV